MIISLYVMIVKRQRIYKGIRFSRRKYFGYTICDALCFGWAKCDKDIREACNQIYYPDLTNYCYVYSDI